MTDYLKSSLDNCAVCSTPCSSSCGACKKVGYCSKEHQQKHWKVHKSTCFPLIVEESSVLGRHLVATRDIKQGEIILKETPIFSGPHRGGGDTTTTLGVNQKHWPICLGCFRLVQSNHRCSTCQWPLCGEECEKDPQHHTLECPLLKTNSITPETFSEPYDIYEVVTVLRGVLSKEQHPKKWTKIQTLQSHSEERNKIPEARKLSRNAIHFIRELCTLKKYTEKEIDHVLGALGVNAFVSDDGVSEAALYRNGTYLYHIASMPAHNCVPNSTWVVQLNSDFHLRAAVPIKCGVSVSFLYTEATKGTYDRQKKLSSSKYFTCACPRCVDPTELKSYFSALKCSECKDYLLPINSRSDAKYKCSNCPNEKSQTFVTTLLKKVDRDLSQVQQDDSFQQVEKLLKILAKHSDTTLHPNHFKIHDIENEILQRVSFLLLQRGSKKCDIKWAEMLVAMATKCIAIADVIWPGFNRQRGRLLYFLQQGKLIVLIASAVEKRKTSSDKLQQLKHDLNEILTLRKEVCLIFAIEPEGREENFIYKTLVNVETAPEIVYLKQMLQF